jgi:hypothetical protein
VSETSTATDTPSSNTTFPTSVSEAASASDTTLSKLAAICSVSEFVTATDNLTNTALVFASVQESITAADAFVRRLLWEPIDDDQSPGWSSVVPLTTINDVATFGGLVFGDVSLAGQYINSWVPDTVQWTEINNSQTVTWTEIVQ